MGEAFAENIPAEPWLSIDIDLSLCQQILGYPKKQAATVCELDNHPLLMGMYVYIYIISSINCPFSMSM